MQRNGRLSTLGGPGRRQEPGRRPQVAGIHFRRKAQRASCKSRVRTACPGLTGDGVTRGRDVSARLPWPTDVPLRGNIGVGTPIRPPAPKQISWRWVRLNATFVFTRVRSLGTGTKGNYLTSRSFAFAAGLPPGTGFAASRSLIEGFFAARSGCSRTASSSFRTLSTKPSSSVE